MKALWKSLKKSEVAIYAIAIMLVAAGYLNYKTMTESSIETISKENTTNITENEDTSNIGDATLVNSGDIVEENAIENSNEVKTEDVKEDNTEKKEENKDEEADYFTNSKLERDTTYASMISNYTAILERDNVSETQKGIAMQEITNINNTKNAIMICENILSTKGFTNCIIFVNDKSVNVVVSIKGGLNTEKVAQIQNIVSRELKEDLNNIHITEK